MWGPRVHGNSVPSPKFYYEPKNPLKIKVLILKNVEKKYCCHRGIFLTEISVIKYVSWL